MHPVKPFHLTDFMPTEVQKLGGLAAVHVERKGRFLEITRNSSMEERNSHSPQVKRRRKLPPKLELYQMIIRYAYLSQQTLTFSAHEANL